MRKFLEQARVVHLPPPPPPILIGYSFVLGNVIIFLYSILPTTSCACDCAESNRIASGFVLVASYVFVSYAVFLQFWAESFFSKARQNGLFRCDRGIGETGLVIALRDFGARAKRESNSNAALFSACTRPNASIILICVICHFHVFYIFMLIYDLIWERHIILSSKSHSRIKVVMNSENCLVFIPSLNKLDSFISFSFISVTRCYPFMNFRSKWHGIYFQ